MLLIDFLLKLVYNFNASIEIEYLNKIGWNKTKLVQKSELIRESENEYCGNLYEDGCKFVCSRFLYEKPVNVLLKRDTLKKISVYNEKIVIN